MVLSKQLQHIHCGGEWSSLAKLAIFVPLSLTIEGKRSAVTQSCVLGIFLLHSQLADVRLLARKQTNPHQKRRGGTERVNARVWQGSKFAVNWEAQTIVIPTLLSGFPRGLIQCQSLLRILRQSLFQAEFSSWTTILLPDSLQLHCLCICVSCCLYLLVPRATTATKTNSCYLQGSVSTQVKCFASLLVLQRLCK